MRWQPVARALVALIGIGCAVAVYVLMRPRPQLVDPPKTVLVDTSVTAETKGTTHKRVDETGRVTFSMRADETRTMADGRQILKGKAEVKFSKNNVRYTVTSNELETSGKSGPTGEEPSQVVFRNKVKMVGDNGFSVEAPDATYLADEQRVVFPGEVFFTRDRLQGHGIGGELFMDRSVLWLNDQASMRIKPEGNGTPVEITAKRIGLAQNENYLRAEERTRITRESQVLIADMTTIHFVEGTQTVRRIELVGKSDVRSSGKSQKPEMRGENIDLDFNPDSAFLTHARMDTSAVLTVRNDSGASTVRSSVIDLYVGADGETLTKLVATGPTYVDLPRAGDAPAKTINSNGLVAEGQDPKGLDRAVFSGNVQYKESLAAGRGQPASVRLASSQKLDLDLDGALDKVTIARFGQNFCYAGPMAVTATHADVQCTAGRKLPARGVLENTQLAMADRADYDARAQTLVLWNGGPTAPSPWIVSHEINLDARKIETDTKGEAIKATGLVNFTRTPAPAKQKASQSDGLFESGKPITGRSNTLEYSKATGLAKYAGKVAIVQGEANRLQADAVTIDDQKQDVTADGTVTSSFLIDQKADGTDKKSPTKTELKADHMAYTEATRKAVYRGRASMETGDAPDNRQSLEADEITLELFADRRELKSLVGVTSGPATLIAKLPNGRQATGLRLTYDAQTDRYVVTGTPVQVVSLSAKGGGICDVGTGTKGEFLRTGGLPVMTSEGATAPRAEEKNCSEVIKK